MTRVFPAGHQAAAILDAQALHDLMTNDVFSMTVDTTCRRVGRRAKTSSGSPTACAPRLTSGSFTIPKIRGDEDACPGQGFQ
jgi:hypothetical protein